MKRKSLVLFLALVVFSQAGFSLSLPESSSSPNIPFGEKQEIFYRMSPEESIRIKSIDGMAYYPKEDAVYLRSTMDSNDDDNLRTESDLRIPSNTIVVKRQGIFTGIDLAFGQRGPVDDFEVDQGKGYELVDQQAPYLRDVAGNGVYLGGMIMGQFDFEVFGKQIAYTGRPYFLNMGFNIVAIPEEFSSQWLDSECFVPFGSIVPRVFDFSADGKSMIVFGQNRSDVRSKMSFQPDRQVRLFIEQLTIPTEPSLQKEPAGSLMPTWPKFEVKADGFGEETQTLMVRDMYTTEEHIVVLFHKLNGELLRNSAVEPGKAFIQRYTYDGTLVDQIETNCRTRRIAPGPGGSTLYVQKRFIEQEEGAESELRFLEPESWQLEIIQMNWEKETTRSGGMRPVIAERSFGGRTLARFADKGFGLLKQVEEETGIVDYRAPLKAKTKDVRLQIPYGDLLAKAGPGARNLMLTYQGHEIAIPFALLMRADLDEMPCQDDATIEIHLKTDEDGNISYTIELFVVEQVNAMTKVVHRKTIQ